MIPESLKHGLNPDIANYLLQNLGNATLTLFCGEFVESYLLIWSQFRFCTRGRITLIKR